MTRGLDPIRTAVVHPVDTPSLLGAVEAARAKLITAVLVGPEHKIRAAAAQAGLDLAPFEIIPTEHSSTSGRHGPRRQGRSADEGALHTDELMRAVVDNSFGLRTARRRSLC